MRSRSTKFWAWTVSIAVHLIVLMVFGFTKFSQANAQDRQQPVPTAKINRIKKLINTAAIIPKPKMKSTNSRFTPKKDEILSTNRIFAGPRQSSKTLTDFANPSVSIDRFSPGAISLHSVEFFGAWTDRRKLCYLVDCSGSMKGLFSRVRKELKDSIASLHPDQYFYIIFFGGDRVLEFGSGRLVRATEKAKSAAYDFIDSARPAGQTNALAALERAVKIRDGSSGSPSVIYFLTDGFELTAEHTQRFPQKIANLLNRFAPATKINTIGFWPADDDRKMLETIARQSGGKFIFVTGTK